MILIIVLSSDIFAVDKMWTTSLSTGFIILQSLNITISHEACCEQLLPESTSPYKSINSLLSCCVNMICVEIADF